MSIPSASMIRKKLNEPRLAILFGCLFLVSQLVIAYIIAPLDSSKLIQLQTTFSVATFQAIIAEWRVYDILYLFFIHQYLDLFLHPIFYSLFLGSTLALSMNFAKVEAKYNFTLFLPFIAGLCDVFENSMHLLLLTETELINTFTVGLSACFANSKWLLCGICILLIIIWTMKGWRNVLFQIKTSKVK